MHSYLESISGHTFDVTSPLIQQGSFASAMEGASHLNLPDSSFFSAVMLIKWSNVMGPEVENVWTQGDQAAQSKNATYASIAKQVLNGEIGRNILEIEPKFLVLGDEGVICTSFLFAEYQANTSSKASTPSPSKSGSNISERQLDTNKISALVFLVPLQYLRNFSNYFDVMVDRVPGLVEKLRRLRLSVKAVKCRASIGMFWVLILTVLSVAVAKSLESFHIFALDSFCPRYNGLGVSLITQRLS
jgi:hypothetical protein